MIFISYSKDDIIWRDRVLTHLGGIDPAFVNSHVWVDSKITDGERWTAAIEKARDRAKVAVLLVSEKYLASAYIRNYEFHYFLQRGIPIYWFLLSDCSWQRSGLSEFQCANVKNGARLVSFAAEHPATVSGILTETCESIYDEHAKLVKTQSRGMLPLARQPISDNFRFNYNRNTELELIELCYRYYKVSDNLLLFSIQGEQGDSLDTFSKSLIYKSLYDTGRESDFEKVLDFKIDISSKYQAKLISPDCIKVIFMNDFYVQARKKLDLDYKLESISYQKIAAACPGKIEWLTISIKITATSFCRELTDIIFSWLKADFNKENYSRENFKIIFIFSFENCPDEDLNKQMHEYIYNAGEWFVPLYNFNSTKFENITGDIKNPFVYHIGKHGKTTLPQFENWCRQEGLSYKDERAYRSLKRKLIAAEDNVDIDSVWTLFEYFEKVNNR